MRLCCIKTTYKNISPDPPPMTITPTGLPPFDQKETPGPGANRLPGVQVVYFTVVLVVCAGSESDLVYLPLSRAL